MRNGGILPPTNGHPGVWSCWLHFGAGSTNVSGEAYHNRARAIWQPNIFQKFTMFSRIHRKVSPEADLVSPTLAAPTAGAGVCSVSCAGGTGFLAIFLLAGTGGALDGASWTWMLISLLAGV